MTTEQVIQNPARDSTTAAQAGKYLTFTLAQEVLDIAPEDLEKAPEFGSSVDTDFILGMDKIGDSVKILLDIDAVLGADNLGDMV